MENFGATILGNPAINVGALHRIAAISGAGFDFPAPQRGHCLPLSVFKLSYKDGYFQQFMMSVLVNLLAGLLAVLMAVVLF